jgi:hypothetical protein
MKNKGGRLALRDTDAVHATLVLSGDTGRAITMSIVTSCNNSIGTAMVHAIQPKDDR